MTAGVGPTVDEFSELPNPVREAMVLVSVWNEELRDEREVSVNRLTPAHIAKFTRALRARLLDTASGFGKAYPNLLVDEVRLDGSERRIKGSYRALARAITLSKEAKPDAVPSFAPEWRPHGKPNQPRLSSGSPKPSYGRDGAGCSDPFRYAATNGLTTVS